MVIRFKQILQNLNKTNIQMISQIVALEWIKNRLFPHFSLAICKIRLNIRLWSSGLNRFFKNLNKRYSNDFAVLIVTAVRYCNEIRTCLFFKSDCILAIFLFNFAPITCQVLRQIIVMCCTRYIICWYNVRTSFTRLCSIIREWTKKASFFNPRIQCCTVHIYYSTLLFAQYSSVV